jgi:long-chain acyl-CoA synthetase
MRIVAGVDNAIAQDTSGKLKVDENDRFLCFLPLAHILEFVYELCAIHWGGTIGYSSPRTLTQDFVRNCHGDIQEFKPTILVAYRPGRSQFGSNGSVPAVWEKIRKKVNLKVSSKNAVIRGVFWTAFKAKSKLMDWGMSGNILNPIFKQVRAATGGNVRLTVCGGAPLAKDTQKFLSITHAPLLVGYGLTETTA